MVNLREHEEAKVLEENFSAEAPEVKRKKPKLTISQTSTRADLEYFLAGCVEEQRRLRRRVANPSAYHEKMRELQERIDILQAERKLYKLDESEIPERLEVLAGDIVKIRRRIRAVEKSAKTGKGCDALLKLAKENLPLFQAALEGARTVDEFQEYGTILYLLGVL